MILKSLANYYERLLNDPSTDIALYGFEDKPIPFVIIITKEGQFVNIRDTREIEDKKKISRIFRVPLGEKKSSGIKANLLWDNPQYVLGIPKSNNKKDTAQAEKAFQAFIEHIKLLFKDSADSGAQAILSFYKSKEILKIKKHELFSDIKETNGNITFMLADDDRLIAQREKILKYISDDFESGDLNKNVCAISGSSDYTTILHTAIKGVWGAKSSGANIVSFNEPAFCSFNKYKKQGLNSPIGKHQAFAYTTALNYLLRKKSKQRVSIGDASTIFWAKNSHPIEDDFSWILGEPPKGEEDIAYGKIKELLSAVKTGIMTPNDDIAFYVLGLAPNAARISVRFWYEGSVKDFKQKIVQYFEDIEIIKPAYERDYLSLFQLLLSIAHESKADKIPPNLSGQFTRSILGGLAFPRTVLISAINRCKAEQSKEKQNVPYARAAIIKAFLMRNARIKNQKEKEVGMALDKEMKNMGYLLGRLFAVLEKIQETAHGGKLNKTIRDTYFSAACSSPRIIFTRLSQLSVHHLAKINNSDKSSIWLRLRTLKVVPCR